jgi:multiple sugar transport system substrate-binding protein
MKKSIASLVAGVLAASAIAGCSSDKGTTAPSGGKEQEATKTAEPPKVSTDPVTLTVFVIPTVDDATLKLTYEDPIRKKYPNITLKYIKHNGSKSYANEFQEMLVAGTTPDFVISSINTISAVIDAGLQMDITPYIQKYKTDLSIYDTGIMDIIKKISPKGETYGFPLFNNSSAMFYNKDIFDRFGVGYPKDGMNWDEVTELARKVTRSDGGTQTRGLMLPLNFMLTANSMSLTLLDPKTDKALYNSEKWKGLYESWKRVFQIPGNEISTPIYETHIEDFTKKRTIAMFAGFSLLPYIEALNDPSLNWDMTALPTFKELPKIGTQLLGTMVVPTVSGKYKEQTYAALTALLSPETQTIYARTGQPILMKDPALKKEFAKDLKSAQGKNTQAIFYNTLAAFPDMSRYELDARNILYTKYREYVTSTKDTNTFMREMEEELNKRVETNKATGK